MKIKNVYSKLFFNLVSLLSVVIVVSSCVTKSNSAPKLGGLDTPEIKAELQKTIDLAGDDESLIITQKQQSKSLVSLPEVHLEPGSEEHAIPTKLFDNLYFVGGTEVGTFIFTTTEGYIMIDSGYNYMPEDYIIPGMIELGLDPQQIKYIMITHAGPDHIGGAKYFQENYGTQIVMSEEEWARMPKDGRPVFGAIPPNQDIIGYDGKEITLGDTTITMVHAPRTVNGGGLSYIAPVYDNGEPHMWATYGNTNVVGTLEDKKVYRESVAKFTSYVDQKNVDVVISNHPFVDGSMVKMEELRNRKPGEPNPFVFGNERVKTFFELLDQCAVVLTLRQEAGLDETGTKLITEEASPRG